MTLEGRGPGPTANMHDDPPKAPRTPEMETLRRTVKAFDEEGDHSQREARDLADAAHALVDLYDTQMARYDAHVQRAAADDLQLRASRLGAVLKAPTASRLTSTAYAEMAADAAINPPTIDEVTSIEVDPGAMTGRGGYVATEGGDGEHPSD